MRLVPLQARHARRLSSLAENDPSFPWESTPPRSPRESALAVIERAQRLRARAAQATFGIEDGDLLVGVILLALDHAVPDRAELGYWITEPARSRGYATAAGRQILRRGFGAMGLGLVFARCPASNRPSVRVLERLGFRLTEGADPVRRHELTRDAWRLGTGPP